MLVLIVLVVGPVALVTLALLRRRSRPVALLGLVAAAFLFLLAAGAALFVLVSRYALSCRLSSPGGCERSVQAPWWLAVAGLLVALVSLYLAESYRQRCLRLGPARPAPGPSDMDEG